MDYLTIPKELSLSEIRARDTSFSAGMYRRVSIPSKNVKAVKECLVQQNPFDKGVEPGSLAYVRESSRFMIRTKALQEHSYLIYPKGDAIVPVNPRAFEDMTLSQGDILMSKDSNVGECAMVFGSNWGNHMISAGIVRLHPAIDRYYLFSFLKHPIFKIQLLALVARGATLQHAKKLWLECLIPFPSDDEDGRATKYVSALMQALVEKELAIQERDRAIREVIDAELLAGQKGTEFHFEFPTAAEIRNTSRFDTGLYCEGFREFKHQTDDYKHGATTLGHLGVRSRRGVNLAVSVIGKSLYSDRPMPGWYELIRPVNISEFGTLANREWLGTKKTLPIISAGEIVLGCEGFGKGRSLVLIDAPEKLTSNFHGTVLYWPGAELWRVIFVRCFIAYLRERGVLDWVGVGGSGGHISPEYFEYLPFPKFPDTLQQQIAALYHQRGPDPQAAISLDTFVTWHRERNEGLGIWELNEDLHALEKELRIVQDKIVAGHVITVPSGEAKASSVFSWEFPEDERNESPLQ